MKTKEMYDGSYIHWVRPSILSSKTVSAHPHSHVCVYLLCCWVFVSDM